MFERKEKNQETFKKNVRKELIIRHDEMAPQNITTELERSLH